MGVSLTVSLPSLSVSRPSGCWECLASALPCHCLGFLPCPVALLVEDICSCATVSLLERLPFPTAGPFGWLCRWVGFLVAALGYPSPWRPFFGFSDRLPLGLALGRCGAVRGGAARFLGRAGFGVSLVFLLKEELKETVRIVLKAKNAL